jgi:hypothetical protein
VVTAVVSTGLGLAVVVASHHVRAAYVGLVVPSVLWLGKASAERSRRCGRLLPEPLTAFLMFPLRRLDGEMGEDMQDWCDARSRAVSGAPQRVSDAAQYYYNQVAGRLKDARAYADLNALRDSIEHKITMLRRIDLDSPARLRAALQCHPSTQDMNKYGVGDLPRLAFRLRSEAEHELHLCLALLYRLGYHKLLIYPSRVPASPSRRHGPGASAGAETTAV